MEIKEKIKKDGWERLFCDKRRDYDCLKIQKLFLFNLDTSTPKQI